MGALIRSRHDVWVRAEDASAIGALRRNAVALAEIRGFGEEDAGRVAVAVSEAGTPGDDACVVAVRPSA